MGKPVSNGSKEGASVAQSSADFWVPSEAFEMEQLWDEEGCATHVYHSPDGCQPVCPQRPTEGNHVQQNVIWQERSNMFCCLLIKFFKYLRKTTHWESPCSPHVEPQDTFFWHGVTFSSLWMKFKVKEKALKMVNMSPVWCHGTQEPEARGSSVHGQPGLCCEVKANVSYRLRQCPIVTPFKTLKY